MQLSRKVILMPSRPHFFAVLVVCLGLVKTCFYQMLRALLTSNHLSHSCSAPLIRSAWPMSTNQEASCGNDEFRGDVHLAQLIQLDHPAGFTQSYFPTSFTRWSWDIVQPRNGYLKIIEFLLKILWKSHVIIPWLTDWLSMILRSIMAIKTLKNNKDI